jgi:hypothetical protein
MARRANVGEPPDRPARLFHVPFAGRSLISAGDAQIGIGPSSRLRLASRRRPANRPRQARPPRLRYLCANTFTWDQFAWCYNLEIVENHIRGHDQVEWSSPSMMSARLSIIMVKLLFLSLQLFYS